MKIPTLNVAAVLATAILLTGCAGRKSVRLAELDEGLELRIPFIAGPAAVLLTNVPGFSAKAVFEIPSEKKVISISGPLLVRDGQIIFLPSESRKLSTSSGFIWSVSENKGYALNEPLQAYAPISSTRKASNVVVNATSGPAEKINGHECTPAQATITLDDGSTTAFSLLRASDLNRLPLRVSGHSPSGPVILTLSDVRLETPPSELFAPPVEFSPYKDVLSMRDELLRRASVDRKPYKGPPEYHDAAREFGEQRQGRY